MERQAFAQTRSVLRAIVTDAPTYSAEQSQIAIASLAAALTHSLDTLARIDSERSERLYTASMQSRDGVSHNAIDSHIVNFCRRLRLSRPPAANPGPASQ